MSHHSGSKTPPLNFEHPATCTELSHRFHYVAVKQKSISRFRFVGIVYKPDKNLIEPKEMRLSFFEFHEFNAPSLVCYKATAVEYSGKFEITTLVNA